MGLVLHYQEGQIPLDEDEKEGLRLKSIATRQELDEFEQQNIEQAVEWTIKTSLKYNTILTEAFVKKLHKRMYGEVWAWAGEFRKTNKNIGIDKWQIPMELRNLLEDARYWIENNTYLPDEIAIRFKHRLVAIHCFPNGNGRHSRLMADIITEKVFRQPVFSWGADELIKSGNVRAGYLHAIRTADGGNIGPLILFARS
ncbi:MAG: mobile mystery protein B [Chitinophagaceae bacterium]|nr:MAG: mobile mystery protein B [Chitinophagaceae bacterium]